MFGIERDTFCEDPVVTERGNLAVDEHHLRIAEFGCHRRRDRALLRALLSGTASKELIPLQTLVEQAVVDRWRRMHPTAPEDPLVRPRTLLVAQLGLALADLLDRSVVDLDQARHLIAELSAVLPRTAS